MIKETGKAAWVLCDNVWFWDENAEKKEIIKKLHLWKRIRVNGNYLFIPSYPNQIN